jgi:hypothetical protein
MDFVEMFERRKKTQLANRVALYKSKDFETLADIIFEHTVSRACEIMDCLDESHKLRDYAKVYRPTPNISLKNTFAFQELSEGVKKQPDDKFFDDITEYYAQSLYDAYVIHGRK